MVDESAGPRGRGGRREAARTLECLKLGRISSNESSAAKERGPLRAALNRYLTSLSAADAPEESVAYATMAIEAILKKED